MAALRLPRRRTGQPGGRGMTRFSPSRRRLGMLPMAAGLAGICPAARARDAGGTRVSLEVTPAEVLGSAVPPVFGFGGNIWLTPGVFGAGVADRILAMPRLGMTRVSLGDQLLEHTSSLADLKQRLEHFALNDFLRRFRQRGGQVMLILDGTPRWLSSNPSTERYKGPNQPYFRVSPAKDMAAWAEVVEALVRHFQRRARPRCLVRSLERAELLLPGLGRAVHGAVPGFGAGCASRRPQGPHRRPRHLVFHRRGTARPPNSEPDKLDAVTRLLDQRYLFRQFLEAAAATPLPELKLARLPVDFFSWHGFYLDPATVYGATTSHIRDRAGSHGLCTQHAHRHQRVEPRRGAALPGRRPQRHPCRRGLHRGSVLAMHAAGVDAQVFQMYVDPGVDGYSGGLWTANGCHAPASSRCACWPCCVAARCARAATTTGVHTAAFPGRAHALRLGRGQHAYRAHAQEHRERARPAAQCRFHPGAVARRPGRPGAARRPLAAPRAREAREREQSGAGQLKAAADRARQRSRSTLRLALKVQGLSGAAGTGGPLAHRFAPRQRRPRTCCGHTGTRGRAQAPGPLGREHP